MPCVELGHSGAAEWDRRGVASLFLCLTLMEQATKKRDEEQSRCELPERRGRHWLIGSRAPHLGPLTHSESLEKLMEEPMEGGVPTPAHRVFSSSAHYSTIEREVSTGHLGSLKHVPSSWETQGTPSVLLRHGSPHGPSQRTVAATPGLAAFAGLSGQGRVWPPTDHSGPLRGELAWS